MTFHYVQMIFDLLKEIAWPLTILIIVLSIKKPFSKAIKTFFENYNLKKISASSTGIELEISQNDKKISEDFSSIEGVSLESLKKHQKENSSPYSVSLERRIIEHLSKFEVASSEEKRLLIKELGITRSNMEYILINRTLFKSQYILFSEKMYLDNEVSISESQNYFNNIKESNPNSFKNWTVETYLAYPLDVNLIEIVNNNYRLTIFGKSYVEFIKKYPNELDYISKL